MRNKNTPILNGAYEVIGVIPGEIGYRGRKVDLSKIDSKTAAALVKEGFPYLRKVEEKKPRKTKVKDT